MTSSIVTRIVLGLALGLSINVAAGAEEAAAEIDWRSLRSIEDVCRTYPQRTRELFEALDLNRDGLQQVKAAFDSGDLPGACQKLLDYYRDCNSGQWLRENRTSPIDPSPTLADGVLNDEVTFFGLTGKMIRLPNGHIDWRDMGPTHDVEWAFELNRHYNVRWLMNGYLANGNEAYMVKADELVRDWIVSSIPLPETDTNRDFMWRAMEAGIRLREWARLFYGFMDNKNILPATRILMLRSLVDHGNDLRQFHAGGGNHVTMDLSALALLGAAWPQFKQSHDWLMYSVDYLNDQITKQAYPDGVQLELTAHYHEGAAYNFQALADICHEVNVKLPETFATRLRYMWGYLAYVMRPDGGNVLNNDGDRDGCAARVLHYAEFYQQPDWTYIATNGQQGVKPEGQPSIFYPYAGQLIMRNGYDRDAQWAFFDVGPTGIGSHAHFDKLHLSVMAGGRDLLVDSGRFTYSGPIADQFRDPYAKHTRGHNSILIDGRGQARGVHVASDPIPAERYAVTEAFDYARGSMDQYVELEGTAQHTRAVMYVRGKFWVVVDRIDGDRPRQIEALWHWNPRCTVQMNDNAVRSTDADACNLSITPLGEVAWDARIVKGQEQPAPQGWYSIRYNTYEPTDTAVYDAQVIAGTTFAWLLLPYQGAGQPQATAQMTMANKAGAVIRVTLEGKTYDLSVPLADGHKPGLKISE